jgi:uncharacterized protein (DUF1330 family)
MMKSIEIDPKDLQAATAIIPENTPILMLNLLRYKEQADYGQRTDFSPCSGQEAYFQRYIPAFSKLAAAIKDIQPFFIGNPMVSLVGEEVWDTVALIEYPNFAAFRQVVENPEYETDALPHRLAAIDNWRLIVTVKLPLPKI